jgi:hypothetical protein
MVADRDVWRETEGRAIQPPAGVVKGKAPGRSAYIGAFEQTFGYTPGAMLTD